MHDHKPRIARSGQVDHGRIAEAAHVVDDRSTCFERRTRNRSMTRIDAHANTFTSQRFHHIEHAGALLFFCYGRGAGTR